MKQLKLTDRIVVEIKDMVRPNVPSDSSGANPTYIADVLRHIADRIEDGQKGECYNPCDGIEILWERECQNYGGFRILSDKSLISQYYYGSEPKPNILPDGEHVVASINKQDLIEFGFDSDSILDDDIASVASRMGKAYHEGYCDCWGEDLRSAAEYIGLKEKED